MNFHFTKACRQQQYLLTLEANVHSQINYPGMTLSINDFHAVNVVVIITAVYPHAVLYRHSGLQTRYSTFLTLSDREIDLLDWHNLLEVNISLGKVLKVPNVQVHVI